MRRQNGKLSSSDATLKTFETENSNQGGNLAIAKEVSAKPTTAGITRGNSCRGWNNIGRGYAATVTVRINGIRPGHAKCEGNRIEKGG